MGKEIQVTHGNVHTKIVAYIQDFLISSVCFITIMLLHIISWWLRNVQINHQFEFLKKMFFLRGWCWHFHRFHCFRGTSQNASWITQLWKNAERTPDISQEWQCRNFVSPWNGPTCYLEHLPQTAFETLRRDNCYLRF